MMLQNYKLFSQHLREECDQPTFVWKFAYLMRIQLLNLCDSNITRVENKLYWNIEKKGKRTFFCKMLQESLFSVIRKLLCVNPCSSVLEQHNEPNVSTWTWDVNHYRNWRGLETSKDLHRVQMPSKIPDCRAANIRPHIPFLSLKDQPRGHSIGCQSRGLLIVFPPAQGCSRGHFCCSFFQFSPSQAYL